MSNEISIKRPTYRHILLKLHKTPKIHYKEKENQGYSEEWEPDWYQNPYQ